MVFVSFIVAAALIEWRVPDPSTSLATSGPQSRTAVGDLPELTSKRVDLVVDTAKLFINWAFAILGVNGFLLSGMAESKFKLRAVNIVMSEISALAALLSLVLGQIAISNTVKLLLLNQFSPASKLISPYVEWQYRSILLAAALTLANAHHFFWRRSTAIPEAK